MPSINNLPMVWLGPMIVIPMQWFFCRMIWVNGNTRNALIHFVNHKIVDCPPNMCSCHAGMPKWVKSTLLSQGAWCMGDMTMDTYLQCNTCWTAEHYGSLLERTCSRLRQWWGYWGLNCVPWKAMLKYYPLMSDAEAETPILWPPHVKIWLIGKDSCWEGLEAGGEGDNRGWGGWMASPTQWTWVWMNSGSWWWTGRPGVLRFMGLQRVGHYWLTELNWTDRHQERTTVWDDSESEIGVCSMHICRPRTEDGQ